MKVAPVMLWLIAIFFPVLIGRNIYFETFMQEQEQISAIGKHQLITRAREFEAKLVPEQIISQQLQLDAYNSAYGQIIYSNNIKALAAMPIVRELPAFKSDTARELASFSSFLCKHTGINPVFVAGLHPDPERCGIFFGDNEVWPVEVHEKYMQEFAQMCTFLNLRSNYGEGEPKYLQTFARFSFFSDYLGIFDPLNTHFWDLHNSFSGRYRERLFFISMRPPHIRGQGNHVIVGILTSRLSPWIALKRACNEFSDKDIKITWGRSGATSFPHFSRESENLEMLIKLPESFRDAFKSPDAPDISDNAVIKLSLSTSQARKKFASHASLVNLAIMVFLSLTLLLAAGTSLGQMKFRHNLARLLTSAFFVSMFLPLSGLAWLGAANSRTSRETESEHIIQVVKQNLRQSETAFLLQRYRQQMLMFFISRVIGNMAPSRWGEYVDRFFYNDKKSPFKAHFNNFYLYSAALDRDFFRGQRSEDAFRKNELPNILSGAFRQALLFSGAFSHLSAAGRQKISQVADFANGVMEEIVDEQFFNKVFSNPAELNNATLLARKDLFSVYFLRSPQNVVGLLCLVTNNVFVTQIIDELNARGSFKNKFTMLNHRIEIDFYAVSEFYERRLKGRDSKFVNENPPVMSIEAADALYSNSDSSIINNLHLSSPHLLVTETMLERSIFAVARITPPPTPDSNFSGPALLALIALLSCLTLATGVSRLILLPVPPFLEALKEIENNRYNWSLDLQTGDEFDRLAISINDMKFSLLERRKMLQLVSQTAAEAAKSGDNTQNSPKRRVATILFADIRGFTTISESHSAEEVVDMLNSYFTLMCPAVEENGGYVDKLIGDAIQAVFFADDEQERVLGAARAALEIRRRLKVFNNERTARGQFTINNGIGIASGNVTTGLTGSKTGKLEAAVMGETIQNAAILESYSKFAANTCIIIDDNSFNAIRIRARIETLSIQPSESLNRISVIELQEV